MRPRRKLTERKKKRIIKMVVKDWDFEHLAFKLTYKQFLPILDQRLGKDAVNRETAEGIWCMVVEEKWTNWETDLSKKDKGSALHRALDQIKQCDGFNAEEHWGPKIKGEEMPTYASSRDILVHSDTGLILPKGKAKFRNVAFKTTYHGFLGLLDNLNGPVLERERAEAAWKYLVKLRWDAWIVDLPVIEMETAKAELAKALEQVKHCGKMTAFEMDQYWREKPDRSAKHESGKWPEKRKRAAGTSGFQKTEDMNLQGMDLDSAGEEAKTTISTSRTLIHTESGLTIPQFRGQFDRFLRLTTYKGFLDRLDEINGPVVEREKAEAAWKYLVKCKWEENWARKPPGLTFEEAKARLEMASNRVKSFSGTSETEIDDYWSEKIKKYDGSIVASVSSETDDHETEDEEMAGLEKARGKLTSTPGPLTHSSTGLILPKVHGQFRGLASTSNFGYKKFLVALDELNGPVVDRKKAEAAWEFALEAKWYPWITKKNPPNLDQAKRELENALYQIKGGRDFEETQMDDYWREKTEKWGSGQARGISGNQKKTAPSKDQGMDLDDVWEEEDEVKFEELPDFNTMVFPFRPKC